jgi:hypothetical protein
MLLVGGEGQARLRLLFGFGGGLLLLLLSTVSCWW